MPANPGRSNKIPHNGRPAERRYAKVDDAADYAQVNPFTIRKMVSDGRIHGYRIGKHLLRVDLNEIDAVMAGDCDGVA
jgi:excisionase family DNA binding protein